MAKMNTSGEELNPRLPDLDNIARKLQKDQLSQNISVHVEDLVNEEYPFDPFEVLGENDFGGPRDTPVGEVGSSIQEFFRDVNVLITGGTGFMGKTLVEKLIRSCPHLKRIYLLIRPKKGKISSERLEDIFEERLFLRLKSEVPDFRSKVFVIPGDMGSPDLALSPADRILLTETIHVVFHGAATVRFDENIKTAVDINVRGVQGMLQLGREMKHLKSFVHVSTAFSHCPRREIDETFYPVSHNYQNVIDVVNSKSDEGLDAFTQALLDPWPNTYTFTKALAEDLIKNEAEDLPLAVVRPSIIVSTFKEPVRGWIDNPYGPLGLVVGAGTGIIHVALNKGQNITDLVPIDVVVNNLLAIAWYRGSSNHQSTPIYNVVSSSQNPIRWNKFFDTCQRHLYKWPTVRAVWYISPILTQSRLLYSILNIFLHVIPGLMLDRALVLSGQKPILVRIYKKLDKASATLAYFSLRQWSWRNENTKSLWAALGETDRRLFFFDVSQIDWDYFCEAMILGLRVNLVKEGLHTLPAARCRWQRLRHAHHILCVVYYLLLSYLTYWTGASLYSYLSNQVLLALTLLTSSLAALVYVAAMGTGPCDDGDHSLSDN